MAADPVIAPATEAVTPSAGPVAVLGPQFCLPYDAEMIMVKKIISISDGDYTVTGADGNLLFTVRAVFLNLHRRRVISDAQGNPLISMQKKVFTARKRWKAFRGDSSDSKDLIFTARKSNLIQVKTTLDVFMTCNKSEQVCDFKIKGTHFNRSCAIHLGESDTILANMRRIHTVMSIVADKDEFKIAVYPNVDYAFVVALVVIFDEINKAKDDD